MQLLDIALQTCEGPCVTAEGIVTQHDHDDVVHYISYHQTPTLHLHVNY